MHDNMINTIYSHISIGNNIYQITIIIITVIIKIIINKKDDERNPFDLFC